MRLALLTLALSFPTLFVGFYNDDFVQRVALSGRVALYRRDAWSLYEFFSGSDNAQLQAGGLLPWFADPEMVVRFPRPLASALIALDARLFGDAALPAHVHSLLWFGAALLIAARIQRALLPERTARWSTLVFAVAGAHAGSTSWIAARHVLIGGAFGLGAWYAALRGSRERRPVFAILGVALLALGFAASEATLSVLPFLLGTLWFDPRAEHERRLRHVAPFVLLTCGYLLFYALGHYGTRHVGSYVSPFDAPAHFLLAVCERVPALLAESFTGLPAILSLDPNGKVALWTLGVLSSGVVFAAGHARDGRLGDEGKTLRFVRVAFVLSLLPAAGTVIDGRVLLVPMVGSSMLIGSLLCRATPAPGERAPGQSWARIGRSALLVAMLGISPLVRIGLALNAARISRIQREMPRNARLACPKQAPVLLINGSDPTVGMYSGAIFEHEEPISRSGWYVLTMASNDLEVVRESERRFTLRIVDRPRRTHMIEALYRPQIARAGSRIRLSEMTVSVLESSDEGPLTARFDLDFPLESSCLVRWEGGAEGHLASVTLPVGGTLRILHEPGPMGL